MSIIIVEKLTKEDIQKAREEYSEYIKITVDIKKEIVAIGGEYHADAELILAEKYQSQSSGISRSSCSALRLASRKRVMLSDGIAAFYQHIVLN